jgi:hypothetical protein
MGFAYEDALTNVSLEADGDQSSNQYKFMKLGTDGIDVQDTSGDPCVGVLQDKPGDGTMGAVAIAGITKVVAGAAVSRGADVQSDSQGVAVEASTTAGELISVMLRPQGQIN